MTCGNSGKLPIRLIALVLIVVLVAGVGVFVIKGKGKKHDAAKEKKPTAPMALGEFVVNLADTGEIRYLKTDVVLAIAGKAGGGGHGESAGADPAIRDAVIGVLSSKHFKELAKPGGKDQLKKEIIVAVNKRLEEGTEAVDVYFNEFAMQ